MEIQKLGDLARWRKHDGKAIAFGSHKVRTIRLDVRAAAPVMVYLHANADGEVVDDFLTLLPAGLSALEFLAGGGSLVLDSKGPVSYFTPEIEAVAFENVEEETFTTIAQRRERNPEVEWMEFLMNQNINARMAAMDEEFQRRLAAMEEREAQYANTSEKAGGSGGGVHLGTSSKRPKQPDAQAGATEPASSGTDRRTSRDGGPDAGGAGKPGAAVTEGEKP